MNHPAWVTPNRARAGSQTDRTKDQMNAAVDYSEEEYGTGWDDDGGGSGGRWLKLKDGDEAMLNVFGKLTKFDKYWPGEEKAQHRWTVSVFNCDTKTVQEWEFGFKVFKTVKAIVDKLRSKNKNIADQVLSVSRTGSGKNDTSYLVMHDDALTDEQRAARTTAIAGQIESEQGVPF